LKKVLKSFLNVLGILTGLLIITMLAFYRQDIPVEELEHQYLTKESAYIQVNDARLHVRKRGKGPVIFLLHGSFSSLHTWNEWENELSKSYTTISIDLPGHGLTGPNKSGIYTTDYYSALVMALADTLRIDTFYVVGNSMGGHITWHMALQNAERVKKIILVNAAGYSATVSDSSRKPTERPFIFKLLGNSLIAKIFTKVTPRFLFKQNLKQVYGNPAQITDEQVDRYYDLMLREGNRQATLERLNQMAGNRSYNISQIQTSTLILWGAKDAWIPVSHAHGFRDAIPNSEIVIFQEAGHIPMEETPQESVKSVIHFLESQ
jgi:pimeloyl-ACP methyl ester carboxylesterase